MPRFLKILVLFVMAVWSAGCGGAGGDSLSNSPVSGVYTLSFSNGGLIAVLPRVTRQTGSLWLNADPASGTTFKRGQTILLLNGSQYLATLDTASSTYQQSGTSYHEELVLAMQSGGTLLIHGSLDTTSSPFEFGGSWEISGGPLDGQNGSFSGFKNGSHGAQPPAPLTQHIDFSGQFTPSNGNPAYSVTLHVNFHVNPDQSATIESATLSLPGPIAGSYAGESGDFSASASAQNLTGTFGMDDGSAVILNLTGTYNSGSNGFDYSGSYSISGGAHDGEAGTVGP